jgi:Rod binding domain-containing protein
MQAVSAVNPHVHTPAAPQPRLAHAAHEFEAQLMKELIRPMTTGSDDEDTEAGSGSALADFAGEALGQSLSRQGGLGLARSIIHELSRTETGAQSGSGSGRGSAGDSKGLKSS